MARVFTRGFEDGDNYFSSDRINVIGGGAVINEATTLSFGDARCIKLSSIAGSNYIYTKIIPQIASYDLSEVYVRIYASSGASIYESTDDVRLTIQDDSGTDICYLADDGTVYTINGTGAASTTDIFAATWRRFEFHIVLAAAGSGGGITIRIDGISVFSSSEDLSSVTAVGYVGAFIQAGTASVETVLIDDIAINDITGVTDNNYPGDARIIGLLPTAAGANTNMTPLSGDNYANVDDAQSLGNDGDTTYVSAATSQELDSYEFESIATKYPSLPSNTAIARVTMMAVCRTPTVGLDIRGVVVDGGTENGVVVTPEGTASYGINGSVVTHPDGSWTYARVESAEFGIESI